MYLTMICKFVNLNVCKKLKFIINKQNNAKNVPLSVLLVKFLSIIALNVHNKPYSCTKVHAFKNALGNIILN